MTGVYQLPFEMHRYDPHDTSLALWQFWGGEARTIAAYTMMGFGLFFLLVFAKTRYPLYLCAALSGILIFPFFGSPGDYFMKIFTPETMLFSHYLGIAAILNFYLFGQFITHRFTPRLNWVFGVLFFGLTAALATMLVSPNLHVFQTARPVLFIPPLITGTLGTWQLGRAMFEKKTGAAVLFFAELFFLLTGFNAVLMALGKWDSFSMIFFGTVVFMIAMMY